MKNCFGKLVLTFGALTVLLGGMGQANANIIFSNFGPGHSYDISTGYIVGDPSGYNEVRAMEFTPTVTSTFQNAIIAIGLSGSPSGSTALVSLESDIASVPGTILEQITVTVNDPIGGSLVTATSVLKPTLSVGTAYWLVASSPDFLGWNLSNSDIRGVAYNSSGSTTGPWNSSSGTVGAFEINGEPAPAPADPPAPAPGDTPAAAAVPEPSTFALLGLGGIGLAIGAYRRRATAV